MRGLSHYMNRTKLIKEERIMNHHGRKTFIVLLALLLITAWTSLLSALEPKTQPKAQQAQAKPQYGGILRLSDMTDGANIGLPSKYSPVYAQRQIAPAIETLFRTDKTGKPVPWLAESYKEDAKGKAITLKLRKGVKFHDGTDFNAEAVKWNLEQYMAAKSGGTEKFKSVDVIDDFIIRINLSDWDNTAIGNMAYMIGSIISPTAFKKNGADWCANNPVGTGPFQFVSWEKGTKTVYKKFPDYWQKGKPYLDGIEWIPMQDPMTRLLSFKKGELDLALSIAAKDVADLKKEGFIVVRRNAGSGVLGVVHDSANPDSPFAKLKVRQAVQHAINSEAIAKTIYLGEAEAAKQWIYKDHWGYNPAVIGYPYNPAKAKQLLKEAGYPNGFKTKITYITSAQDDQIYTAVQGFLMAVGIEAELETITSPKWTQIALTAGKWDGMIQAGVTGNPDVAGTLASRYIGGDRYYTQMLAPEEYVKAVENAITAPDFKTKQKWTHTAMKLMIDKYCIRTVFSSRPEFGVGKKTLHDHGFFATPNTAWWTPEDTWMEK
jgi:peptide/nickel transport system substrate-binding protein